MVLSETRGLQRSSVERGGIEYTLRLGAGLGRQSSSTYSSMRCEVCAKPYGGICWPRAENMARPNCCARFLISVRFGPLCAVASPLDRSRPLSRRSGCFPAGPYPPLSSTRLTRGEARHRRLHAFRKHAMVEVVEWFIRTVVSRVLLETLVEMRSFLPED